MEQLIHHDPHHQGTLVTVRTHLRRLKEQSKGEMPVLKDSGRISAGLENLISYVEEKFPEPALGQGDASSTEDR